MISRQSKKPNVMVNKRSSEQKMKRPCRVPKIHCTGFYHRLWAAPSKAIKSRGGA